MRSRIVTTLCLCVAVTAVLGVGTSYADSVATGGATAVTSTSAILSGVTNAGGHDMGWAFQYGTSTVYQHITAVQPADPNNPTAVSTKISGLTPGTTYHFRLVGVEQVDTTLGPMYFAGSDLTFKTLPATTPGGNNPGGNNSSANNPGGHKHGSKFGRTRLARRRLKVKGGFVSIPLKCTGASGARCRGHIALSTTHTVGKTKRTLSCASVKFSTYAGHTRTVRAKIGRRCLALLKASRRHSVSASLKATSGPHERALRQGVTLFA